jgi:hypothetical protein
VRSAITPTRRRAVRPTRSRRRAPAPRRPARWRRGGRR